MSKAKYWAGSPSKCDVCDALFEREKKMYDARVPPGSQWGNICKSCFTENGCALGTGMGQEYTKQNDGKWLKTGG